MTASFPREPGTRARRSRLRTRRGQTPCGRAGSAKRGPADRGTRDGCVRAGTDYGPSTGGAARTAARARGAARNERIRVGCPATRASDTGMKASAGEDSRPCSGGPAANVPTDRRRRRSPPLPARRRRSRWCRRANRSGCRRWRAFVIVSGPRACLLQNLSEHHVFLGPAAWKISCA